MSTQTTARLDRVRELIDEELPHLLGIRHDLHAHPELSYEEVRTSGVVQRELGEAGIEFVPELAGGTGVLGHLPGTAETALGLRADMDALPIHEETGLGYASKTPGKMHACGHDGHTTILYGPPPRGEGTLVGGHPEASLLRDTQPPHQFLPLTAG